MLVESTSLETARSFISRTLERALGGLMTLAGLLAFASVPGTLLGLIPWPLCATLWGITVASMVLGELVSERIARAQADARPPPGRGRSDQGSPALRRMRASGSLRSATTRPGPGTRRAASNPCRCHRAARTALPHRPPRFDCRIPQRRPWRHGAWATSAAIRRISLISVGMAASSPVRTARPGPSYRRNSCLNNRLQAT